MIWEMENFSRTPEMLGEIQNGDTLIACNLWQPVPDTPVLLDRSGLRFVRCNLINCNLPADSEINECNTSENIYEFYEEGEEPTP